jgi:hypothetical protein
VLFRLVRFVGNGAGLATPFSGMADYDFGANFFENLFDFQTFQKKKKI